MGLTLRSAKRGPEPSLTLLFKAFFAFSLRFPSCSHLGGVNDAEGVALGKLMQLQFCPGREHGEDIRNTHSWRGC